jgi:hypothetical protein
MASQKSKDQSTQKSKKTQKDKAANLKVSGWAL